MCVSKETAGKERERTNEKVVTKTERYMLEDRALGVRGRRDLLLP
jgi:hypothetical protein